jgi:hypothetical protein
MSALALIFRQATYTTIAREFTTLCLWPAGGLALTGLFFVAGLGAGITQALAG